MKKLLLLTCYSLVALHAAAQSFTTPFEQSRGKQTTTYTALIDFYDRLDKAYASVSMQTLGATDAAVPLHVVYYSKDGQFDIKNWKQQGKLILFINNGIHPGEPDGIDASMLLLRDVAEKRINVPEHIVLAVIPVFNTGGMLNRGSYSRANQNGPEAYGFRGNGENRDLNRDFIKMDAQETRSLLQLFQALDPDILIDNHVSNGADYQHVMTLLTPNEKKQGYYTGTFLKQVFEPYLYESMKKKGYDLAPYVNHWGDTPDKGWQQFNEPPRFMSGYAALFRTFAFVPETHMLKLYKQRVMATYDLMRSFIEFAVKDAKAIKEARDKEWNRMQEQKEFTLSWKVDSSVHSGIPFKGYEAKYKPSKVSGKPRLYYARNRPYTKTVPFYDTYLPVETATAPQYYVLPAGWNEVVRRLQANGVDLQPLSRDTAMELTVYRIKDYETVKQPFEGHYLHTKLSFGTTKEKIQLHKGDYLIPVQQKAKRYLLETLQPNAPDAFFAWNFFDAVLQQKEHFSDYVFEDEAAQYLSTHPELQHLLDEKRRSDTAFAQDGAAQLEFVYRNSPFLEPEYKRYPVFRID